MLDNMLDKYTSLTGMEIIISQYLQQKKTPQALDGLTKK